jgi:hypothetical protein
MTPMWHQINDNWISSHYTIKHLTNEFSIVLYILYYKAHNKWVLYTTL